MINLVILVYHELLFNEFSVFKYLNSQKCCCIKTVFLIWALYSRSKKNKRQILCGVRVNRGPAFSKDKINLKP